MNELLGAKEIVDSSHVDVLIEDKKLCLGLKARWGNLNWQRLNFKNGVKA